MTRPTNAIINTSALQNNLQQVKNNAPQQKIMAVVKANAYGHGAARVANAIANDIDAFAVCCLEEALQLRDIYITQPIVILEGFFHPDELPIIIKQDLQIVISTATQFKQLTKATLEKPVNIWIKVETGMHRLGFNPKDAISIYQLAQQNSNIADPIRLMSHLACADDLNSDVTTQQTKIFSELVQHLKVTEASLANSAGILGWPETYFDWVRPGIMLYGASPFPNSVAEDDDLQPVMQLQSQLISVKRCYKGETVGYGATWACPQTMPIGVIAVGYADGYPRHAPIGTPVLVNGKRVPLVGRVSMDMITVDLRNQPNARVGDPVLLWGKDLPAEEIASLSGTIAYELFCNLGGRVKKESFSKLL
ncbi:alanine racemase [Candidatus Halobeggiatoa sp. HSG11]|nr:alanine racemase [Candidatus Halobeggiatoa sp. HSG11]